MPENTSNSTLQSPQSALHNFHMPHSTLHSPHFTLHTLHTRHTLHTLHTLRTLHTTLYTPNFTLLTPHSELYTPNSTLNIPDPRNHTPHFTLTRHSIVSPLPKPLKMICLAAAIGAEFDTRLFHARFSPSVMLAKQNHMSQNGKLHQTSKKEMFCILNHSTNGIFNTVLLLSSDTTCRLDPRPATQNKTPRPPSRKQEPFGMEKNQADGHIMVLIMVYWLIVVG